MDRRISLGFFSVALALASSGCIHTQGKNGGAGLEGPANAGASASTKSAAKDDGPKRKPHPKTEIAFGNMKEIESDSEHIKKHPEIQVRMRDEARQAYQHAIALDPGNLDAHRHLARVYTKLGHFDRALDVYKKILAKHPNDAALWYDLGLCHQRRKDLNESVRCLTKAVEIAPENGEYLKKLGFTLAWMGQYEPGFTYLARAQGPALAHYGLARVFVERDQYDLASHHLRMALRENGELEQARELLASLPSASTSSE